MASQEQVRNFLAHWFQLGKPVVVAESRGECLPSPVFQGEKYSSSFENCWRKIMVTRGRDCYLSGTNQSIAELLLPAWDVTDCARCDMPIVLPTAGMMTDLCPCNDLDTWPNTDVPTPRPAVDSRDRLGSLQQRLGQ
ncbi:MAG: hypothetical protein EA368_10685 [Leptolyngbya sp. DLM2.Bin27]|nr:MAG: hypothetical protein EA368_10685 [Leptolyngbya sp. DLM2.Bin27]